MCGCTEQRACVDPRTGDTCSWLDAARTLCSNVRCVALVPLEELMAMTGVAA